METSPPKFCVKPCRMVMRPKRNMHIGTVGAAMIHFGRQWVRYPCKLCYTNGLTPDVRLEPLEKHVRWYFEEHVGDEAVDRSVFSTRCAL